MSYNAQVVIRARQRLEQAKAEREALQQQRLQQVYQAIPRVREIDRQLRQSMVLAAQAVFAKGEEAIEAMEQVKKANQLLQQQRQALITEAFGPDFLDESPICDKCQGVGYVGSQMCTCLRELCRQEQKKELSLLSCGEGDFQDFRLDYYPDRVMAGSGVNVRRFMEKTFSDCRKYAEEFDGSGKNLLFSGDTGLGKTFLSACIARCVADKGYSVAYESAVHLIEKLERARFSDDPQAVQEARRVAGVDLLIIDDLGTELSGQFVNTALYTLLNDRLLEGLSTVISTNLTSDELQKRYSPQILSRLRGSYKRVPFIGEDIRILKSREEKL